MLDRLLSAPADPLGEALHFLRMSGAFYCRSELTAPWGLALPAMRDCVWFHVVTAGRCVLDVSGAAPLVLHPGALALVPHGEGHALASERGVYTPRLEDLPEEKLGDRYGVLRHGGGGAPTTLICGVVRFDHPAAHQLVTMLPRIMHVDPTTAPDAEWIQGTLRMMAAEARALLPGGEAVITRLADILVVQAIRSWIRSDPAARTGWLGALRDPQIGRALAIVHRDPAREWTLASLASEVAMSRSAFAARFTESVGEPAMQYVARLRMHLALSALRDDRAEIGELASRLGYRSEAAFRRAFKRFVGISPGAVRRAREGAAHERARWVAPAP